MRKILNSDMVFRIVVTLFCALILVIILYPLYFVVIASVSDPTAVSVGQVTLWPVGASIRGYQLVLEYESLWVGYRNTIFYTFVGTLFNLFVTLPAAYAASRREFMPRRVIMFLFVFTMYFGGGLIPTFLLYKQLKIYNTIWVFIIPFSLNVYNFIITRTFFETSLSESMHEAAVLDGCSEIRYFCRIVLPLSRAIIAVIALYYGVAHWNDYFTGLVFTRNKALQPLQLVLREIILIADSSQLIASSGYSNALSYVEAMRYGVIIVSTLPLLVVYPFIQRYFEKGVMIGAVKG